MMESKEKLNQEIIKLTTEIMNNYPELVKYLEEMPDTLPVEGKGNVEIEELKKYLNSLKEILSNYHKKY